VLLLVSAVLYCFGQNEFLAFLVLSLALSWVNLLYYFRGSKHMGIYSIMIQKVRDICLSYPAASFTLSFKVEYYLSRVLKRCYATQCSIVQSL